MVFSKEWNKVYELKRQINKWPFSDLVSFVLKYARPTGKNFRVLELGCGTGPNIPFFKELGVQYYAIEGSNAAVNNLRKKYPDLKNNIICADFTTEIFFDGQFDLVVDRSSLTHNSTVAISQCLENIRAKLKPAGKFIGIDWFSTRHCEFTKGKTLPHDKYTKLDFKKGQFAEVGIVHFSDRQHLLRLFERFKVTVLLHKSYKSEIPRDGFILAVWNFVAEKK